MRNVTHCACIYMSVCVHIVPMSILMCFYGCLFIFLYLCVVPFLFWEAMSFSWPKYPHSIHQVKELTVVQLSVTSVYYPIRPIYSMVQYTRV